VPVSRSRTYRLSPHSGKCSSSGIGSASIVQPSGANSAVARSTPPRQGTAGSATSSGIGVAASSGRSFDLACIAVRNTRPMATASSDDAAYGRSLTYCFNENASVARLPRAFTSPIGSTSSSSAAVHRCSDASGKNTVALPYARFA